MMAHESDRRERKRRASENAIEEAAVTLALAYGHDADLESAARECAHLALS